MRPIKFRAWHEDAGGMVYFGLGEDNISVYSSKDGQQYTLRVADAPSVMQFTGLHDKNGVEIWEGDICRTYKYGVDNEGWSRLTENNKKYYNIVVKYLANTPFCGFVVQGFYEVIGNIYENPELLEQ
jgi:uncharacterized phage protein (TIGR01671 family)